MPGNFQDDDREDTMRELFNLYKDEEEGRSGIDAFLDIDTKTLPFELKTTSNGSVTTVRDFGPDHITKWKNKHWLIGFFINGVEYYKYVSPLAMSEWIAEKEKYISPDFSLAEIASVKLRLIDLYKIVGKKKKYTLEDARTLHKKQYTKKEYLALQDVENGYSPAKMLNILKDRARYLIERGSTLNNPHIPLSYFEDIPKITKNHAVALREEVQEYLDSL
ncbi:MAG: hypothetical protein COA44_14375 [Arcobacter sp.]|nr:MAG: hypothetical protein COA44_14375 [Arcobacter sp.]